MGCIDCGIAGLMIQDFPGWMGGLCFLSVLIKDNRLIEKVLKDKGETKKKMKFKFLKNLEHMLCEKKYK